jgi:PKHD-type hydroxylase|tara:strand:+ start:542 stop:1135 length:594 start_codon:yes stop_codon:yes gene_type:complete
MYDNIIITEPKWKSWAIETTTPLFTPDQCRKIIECGRRQKPQTAQIGMGKPGGGTDTRKRVTTISWIPFKEMSHMYEDLNNFIQKANRNHFGFGDIRITEQAQFTEYPVGGFYDWHMDCDVNMAHEPPVRKISMTVLLNHESEFEGGHLEVGNTGKIKHLKQGNALVFASFIHHRVQPVIKGVRQSLVVWFGGEPFK